MDDKPNINCRCSFWKEYADTFIKQPNRTTFSGDGTTSNQLRADSRVQQIEFDYALGAALTAAKARNATAVKALLNMDGR